MGDAAGNQSVTLEQFEHLARPTPQRMREIARKILTEWQNSGAVDDAGDYMHNLLIEAIRKLEQEDAADG